MTPKPPDASRSSLEEYRQWFREASDDELDDAVLAASLADPEQARFIEAISMELDREGVDDESPAIVSLRYRLSSFLDEISHGLRANQLTSQAVLLGTPSTGDAEQVLLDILEPSSPDGEVELSPQLINILSTRAEVKIESSVSFMTVTLLNLRRTFRGIVLIGVNQPDGRQEIVECEHGPNSLSGRLPWSGPGLPSQIAIIAMTG